MSSKVHTDFTSDGKQLMKTLQDSQKEIEKLTNENRKLRDESKRAAKEGTEGFEKWRLKIDMATASQDLMNEALEATKGLMNEIKEVQDKIAQSQQTAAGSQRAFLRNLGNVDDATRNRAISEVGAISDRTGVTQQVLYQAASVAMSARGGTSIDDAMRAVEMAARISPESAGEITSLTGALLDVGSLTGSADPQQNMGLITAMAQQARVTDLTKVSQNLVPAAIGVKGFGGTAGEASALTTTLTQAMKDATGAMSGTASVQLAKQLEEFKPTAGIEGGTDDRIRALQADEKLREKFLKEASFEAKAFIPIRDLLTSGTETARLFEQNIEASPIGEAAKRMAADFEAGLNAPELQQAADRQRRAEQEIEDYDLSDLRSGDASRVRKRVNDLLDRSGASVLSPMRTIFEFSSDPNITGERILTSRAAQIRGDSPEMDRLARLMEQAVKELQQQRKEASERDRKRPATVVGGNPDTGR